MSITTRLVELREALHRRKHNRERKRRRHQGHRAHREARAIKRLRALIHALLDRRHQLPRVMFDDVTLSLVPKVSRAIGFYVNGLYANGTEAHRRFPRSRHVGISVTASQVADVLDIETGDATIAEATGYYRSFKGQRPHGTPIFYTSVSNADSLVNTLAGEGIARGRYKLWLAHYGDGKHICAWDTCGLTRQRADGTQWTDSSHGRSLDESYLRPSFWT